MHKLLLFLGICSAYSEGSKLPVTHNVSEKIVGCYYTGTGGGKAPKFLTLENIDASLCTHFFSGWVELNKDASISNDYEYTDIDIYKSKGLVEFRKKNRHLKTIISMGETSTDDAEAAGSGNNKVLTDPKMREKLVDNIVDFLRKYKVNGVELKLLNPDPSVKLIAPDKENFVLLLKALREKFDKEGFILFVADDGSRETDKVYDFKEIPKYADFVNLMTYDFHTDIDPNRKVSHNAPMYPSPKESAQGRKLNVDSVVRKWISKGAPPRKLMLGIPFHGISYTLANPQQHGTGALYSNSSKLVSSTPSYNEMCSFIKNPEWKRIYDKEQQGPYIYKKDQMISYDDVESIRAKVEYAKKMNLGGVFGVRIDEDDFNGNCGEKFPLLKTLNRVLRDKH